MTDFGLSKEGLLDKDDRTGTFCGTPEYLAPEVLEGKGYGKAVDWWSFGTLVYEMLTGLPPFYSEDVQHMYTKIMTAELEIPDTMSPEAGDLLTKLLDRDPDTRLQDPREIRKHPFFAPLDFEKLIAKQIRPPWIPETNGEADTQNIDSSFLDEVVTLEDGYLLIPQYLYWFPSLIPFSAVRRALPRRKPRPPLRASPTRAVDTKPTAGRVLARCPLPHMRLAYSAVDLSRVFTIRFITQCLLEPSHKTPRALLLPPALFLSQSKSQ